MVVSLNTIFMTMMAAAVAAAVTMTTVPTITLINLLKRRYEYEFLLYIFYDEPSICYTLLALYLEWISVTFV